MTRNLYAEDTFDTLLEEVYHSQARLEDEPAVRHLGVGTEPWVGWILEAERQFRAATREAVGVRAARTGANEQLDATVIQFGRHLDEAVDRDHDTGRWRGFFRTSVTVFNRQPLEEQVRTVKGWLSSEDPVLVAARPVLGAAVERVDRALTREAALAARRGAVWSAREALAEKLNDARRALEAEIEAIAQDQGLPKSWVASFFLVGGKDGAKAATGAETAPTG